jgi:hypothetical protein
LRLLHRRLCLRFRLCRRLRLGLGLVLGSRGRLAAFSLEQSDRLADLHSIGAFGDQDLGDRALVNRLELHCRLVGFDLGKNVAGGHLVALLDQPFGQSPLLHRRREGRHFELERHQ